MRFRLQLSGIDVSRWDRRHIGGAGISFDHPARGHLLGTEIESGSGNPIKLARLFRVRIERRSLP